MKSASVILTVGIALTLICGSAAADSIRKEIGIADGVEFFVNEEMNVEKENELSARKIVLAAEAKPVSETLTVYTKIRVEVEGKAFAYDTVNGSNGMADTLCELLDPARPIAHYGRDQGHFIKGNLIGVSSADLHIRKNGEITLTISHFKHSNVSTQRELECSSDQRSTIEF